MKDPRQRREPGMGNDPLALLAERREPELPTVPSVGPAPDAATAWWPWALLFAGLLLAGIALVVWREPLGRLLVPDAPLTRQLQAAESALKRGELSRTDGRGARELFQAVLATDPDHPGARQGLAAVRDAAVALAGAALDVGDRVRAREALALATALSAPAAQLQPLQERLAAADASLQDIERLLVEAQTLQRQGRDDDALGVYLRVLERQPDSSLALAGRQQVLAQWLRQAQEKIAVGDLAAAEATVAKAAGYDPSHVDLPAVRVLLGERQAERQRLRAAEQRAAETALAAGRLEQAWQIYQRLLGDEPKSESLRSGASRVMDALAARVRRQLGDFEFAAAEADLATLQRWAPQAPSVRALQEQLKRSRSNQQKLPVVGDVRQLPALMQQATEAIAAGRLVSPPGDNAWDALRRAVAISPDDAAISEALRRFEQAARECFESHALANRLSDAEACLDARSLREPPQALADARRRLALRWLALGNERIGQNEPELARRALDNAKRLDVRAPGIANLEQRLALVWDASR